MYFPSARRYVSQEVVPVVRVLDEGQVSRPRTKDDAKSHVLASLNHQFVTIRENFEVKDSRNNSSFRSIIRFIEKRRVFKNGQNRTLHAISIHM